MMLERADLKRLRLPLVVALVLANIGIAALLYSENRLAGVLVQKKAAAERLAATRTRLAKVSEEEQEIRNNLVQFKQFEDRKMTGVEKRLEWIETLAAIRQQRRLFEVHYNLERQRPVDYPGVKNADAIFLANKLKLDLLLLHEEDLLKFIADLGTNGPTFAALRSCSITRADGGAGAGGQLRARVRAECSVDMITMRTAEKPS